MRGHGPLPKTVVVSVFHVRDVDRVKKMLGDFRSSLEKKGAVAKKRAVPKSRHADGITAEGSHMSAGPMHLTCDDHLLLVAPSRPTADALCELIGETLEGAIEHVQTRTYNVPKEAQRKRKRSAGDRPPSGNGRHRPRRRISM